MIKKGRRGGRALDSSDGVDEAAWEQLAEMLSAANRGDGNTFLNSLKRTDAWSDQTRNEAAGYLAYLLRYRVAEILGRRPVAEDIHDLAVRTYPRYAKVVEAPASMLEDTLRAVFKMSPLGTQQSGARLFVSGTAAAGVLFGDPSADLAVIRPHIAAWRLRDV
jgi:hypothetical protein